MKTYQIRLYEQHANGTETLSDIMEFESEEQNPSILSLVRHLFEDIEARSDAASQHAPLKYSYTDEQEAFVLDNCVTDTEENFLRQFPTEQWAKQLAGMRGYEASLLLDARAESMIEALQETRAEMNELGEVDPYTRAMNYALVILAEDDEFYGTAPQLFASIARERITERTDRLAEDVQISNPQLHLEHAARFLAFDADMSHFAANAKAIDTLTKAQIELRKENN